MPAQGIEIATENKISSIVTKGFIRLYKAIIMQSFVYKLLFKTLFLFLLQNALALLFLLSHLRNGEFNVENDNNIAKTVGYLRHRSWDFRTSALLIPVQNQTYLSEVKYFMTERDSSGFLYIFLFQSRRKELCQVVGENVRRWNLTVLSGVLSQRKLLQPASRLSQEFCSEQRRLESLCRVTFGSDLTPLMWFS